LTSSKGTPARRGEVVAVRASRSTVGHEQKGTRPAVIVQSDRAGWLGTVIVAPTSTGAQPAEFRPEVTVRGRTTRVLLDQLKTVDRGRLGRSSGHLAAADLREVDEALSLVLGLF
jgi:mRNA interferase MazF